MSELVEVVIDRSKWCRGGKGGPSGLLNSEGNRCCLGFASSVLGATEPEMLGQDYPNWLKRPLPGLNEYGGAGFKNTAFSLAAAKINDDKEISDETRESELSKLALASGFQFTFVDGTESEQGSEVSASITAVETKQP